MKFARDSANVIRYIWRHPANSDARAAAILRSVAFQARGRLGLSTVAKLGTRSRLVAELHSSAAAKVVYANPPDWPEMKAWRRILRPGDLFVDVGSNVGTYAIWAAEGGADVIAVEPSPTAAGKLARNVEINGYPIDVLQCALSSDSGVMMLTDGLDTMNHLTTEQNDAVVEVPVRTLDDVVGDRVVAGVKVDVEGAERLVLEGGTGLLSEQRIKVIQLEWNDQSYRNLRETRAPLRAMLQRYGYAVTRPDPDGALWHCDSAGYGSDLFAVAHSAIDTTVRVNGAQAPSTRPGHC